MRIVIAGATGFLGQAWREHLARRGTTSVRLIRGRRVSSHESRLGPAPGEFSISR